MRSGLRERGEDVREIKGMCDVPPEAKFAEVKAK